MKRNKHRARFGVAWWDRNGHFSSRTGGEPATTWGSDEFGRSFAWPRPCAECVELMDQVER